MVTSSNMRAVVSVEEDDLCRLFHTPTGLAFFSERRVRKGASPFSLFEKAVPSMGNRPPSLGEKWNKDGADSGVVDLV